MKSISHFIAACCCLIFTASSHAQIITTCVGDTSTGYSGDGGPATNAKLSNPSGIALDTHGNMYIADRGNFCIRKVDTHGIITTIAGTGVMAYSADSIAATSATLQSVTGLATDAAGNVYIDDMNRLRKIDTNGIITTLYADRYYTNMPTTIAINPKGEIYFGNFYGIYHLVMGTAVNVSNTWTGPAITYQSPNGMMFDSLGNLYIANSLGSTGEVLKVDTGGYLTWLGGDGACGSGCADSVYALSTGLYSNPGIARDNNGNTYFTDNVDGRIIKMAPTGFLTTYAGTCFYPGHSGDGGLALQATLNLGDVNNAYNSMVMDKQNNLYVVESGSNCVRKISPSGTRVTTAVAAAPVNNSAVGLSIYPNPSAGTCTLLVSGPGNTVATVTVVNAIGECVTTLAVPANRPYNASLSLPAGVYVVSAATPAGTTQQPLVIN